MRPQTGDFQGAPEQLSLRTPRWRRQRRTPPDVIHTVRQHHSQRLPPPCPSPAARDILLQAPREAVLALLAQARRNAHGLIIVAIAGPLPLQDHGARTLAAHIAVRTRVERLTAAVRRDHAGLRAEDEAQRREHQLHAAYQDRLALAGANPGRPSVQRHERRRACRVDRHAVAPKTVHIRDAVRQNRHSAPHSGVTAAEVAVGLGRALVVGRRRAGCALSPEGEPVI
mmetsp:Transcript_9883/g.28446  ORF Transcript_9883/g.28446 Transcript_9883/m.28446 type:complete len:227 (+) Transcript_9883:1950-2630(+)